VQNLISSFFIEKQIDFFPLRMSFAIFMESPFYDAAGLVLDSQHYIQLFIPDFADNR
jgi:hypothetical protein